MFSVLIFIQLTGEMFWHNSVIYAYRLAIAQRGAKRGCILPRALLTKQHQLVSQKKICASFLFFVKFHSSSKEKISSQECSLCADKTLSNKNIYKQVRTNIGLADTLIHSSFIYLIYMEGTGPCDSIKIIFGYHVNSQHIILNIKFGVNRTFHVLQTPVYRFDLQGRYQTLCIDDENFLQCELAVAYMTKY